MQCVSSIGISSSWTVRQPASWHFRDRSDPPGGSFPVAGAASCFAVSPSFVMAKCLCLGERVDNYSAASSKPPLSLGFFHRDVFPASLPRMETWDCVKFILSFVYCSLVGLWVLRELVVSRFWSAQGVGRANRLLPIKTHTEEESIYRVCAHLSRSLQACRSSCHQG